MYIYIYIYIYVYIYIYIYDISHLRVKQKYTKHTTIYKTIRKRTKRTSLHCNTSLHFTILRPTTLHYTSLLHIYTSLPSHCLGVETRSNVGCHLLNWVVFDWRVLLLLYKVICANNTWRMNAMFCSNVNNPRQAISVKNICHLLQIRGLWY